MSHKYLLSRRYLPYAVVMLLISIMYFLPVVGLWRLQDTLGWDIQIPMPGLYKTTVLSGAETIIFTLKSQTIIMELMGILGIASALVIAFTREKTEDEFVSELRKQSLVWAVIIHYIVFALGLLFINDELFLEFEHISVITPVLLYLLRFRYVMYRANRQMEQATA